MRSEPSEGMLRDGTGTMGRWLPTYAALAARDRPCGRGHGRRPNEPGAPRVSIWRPDAGGPASGRPAPILVMPGAAGASHRLPPEHLTPREREVAALIGRGYTNRRIADELVITERTAETHARNVRERLGLTTRAHVAAWAVEHGLLSEGAT